MSVHFPTVYWSAWDVDATFSPDVEALDDGAWAVLTVLFHGDRLVLADIPERGLCIPSGKVQPGETCKQAALREVFEETGASMSPGSLRLIGGYTLTARSADSARRYCPVFIAEAQAFHSIPTGSESQGIRFVSPEDLPSVYYMWDELLAAVLSHAQERRNERKTS